MRPPSSRSTVPTWTPFAAPARVPSTATLVLRVEGPAALEIQHKSDVILERVNRFTGNVQLNAKPIDGMNIDLIFGLDNYAQLSTAYIPPRNTTPSYDGGLSRTGDAQVLQTNLDLNMSYRKKLNSWLESTTALGGTSQYDRANTLLATAQQLGAFGQTVSNTAGLPAWLGSHVADGWCIAQARDWLQMI